MPDRNASIILQLRDQASANVKTAAANFATLDKAQQAAAKSALTTEQNLAKLEAALKSPASAAQRLAAALQNATALPPGQAAAALQQLDRLEIQAAKDAEKLANDIAKIGKGGVGPALPRTVDGLSGSALTAAKGFLTLQAAEKGFAFVKTGAEIADVTASFNSLALAAHTTGAALLGSLHTAADGTITDAALVKSANLGLLLTHNTIASSLPQLVGISRATAKATGQDIDFIYDSLVRGIARGSPRIIDNSGITLDAAKAFDDYAHSIGKTASQLTGSEQQQATLNAVLKAGNDIIKTVGNNAEDSSVKIAKAETAVKNLGNTLATKIAPFAGDVAQGVSNVIETGGVAPGAVAAGNQVQGTLVNKSGDYQAYAAGVQKANDDLQSSIGGIAGWYARARLGLDTLTPAQFAYAQSLIATGTASTQAFTQAQAMADVGVKLEGVDLKVDRAGGERAATYQRLIPLIYQTSALGEHEAQQVHAVADAYANGDVSGTQFETVLHGLINSHNAGAAATARTADENNRLLQSFGGLGSGIQKSTNALSDDAVKKIDSQIAAAQLADEQARLTKDSHAAALGMLGAGDQALILAKKYDIATDHAQFLINQQLKLASTAGLVDQRAGEHSGGSVRSQGELDGLTAARKANTAYTTSVQAAENQLSLARAKTSAEKIAILKREQAQTGDAVEKIRLQTQIEQERNSSAKGHTGELNKQLNLQEGIHDSLEKQYKATLDIQKTRAQDVLDRIKEDAEIKTATRILNSPNANADFKRAAQAQLDLIDANRKERQLDIADKTATAQGTIVNGKIFQSIPQGGAAPAVPGAPGPGGTAPAVSAPAASATPAAGGAPIQLVLTDAAGAIIAKLTAPILWDELSHGARHVALTVGP